jgi:imidazolonepropionase-like amidohydrolase
MKWIYALIAIALFSSFIPESDNQITVIQNVNVIPMDREHVLMNHSVIIKNGKIDQIVAASGASYPAKVRVIDGTGKYLIPGLMDMHAHFFYEQGENINTCEAELKMMLANGLTTVRIECGDSVYLHARQMVRKQQWVGPELFVSSPQVVGKWPWKGKMLASICTTPAEAEAAVQNFKAEGYDEVKITFMVKADVYDAIIKTAAKEGIKVTGHVGPQVKLPRALAAHQQIEHMDEFIEMLLPDTSYNHGMSVSDMGIWRKANWETLDQLDENRIPALVKMVKDAGIYVTPTNYFFISCFGDEMSEEEIKAKPDYAYVPANINKERWEVRKHYLDNHPTAERRKKYVYLRHKMTRELWKGGVKLMAGSDSPEWFLVQGFAIHNELQEFVRAGLTPYAALETATKNSATYLGIINQKGTIAVGKEADLVLLDANPLENIANTTRIAAVFHLGKVYDSKEISGLLQQARLVLNP